MKKIPIAYTVIWLLLFGYGFTYYGNHGLGDTARIPLGYGKDIVLVDSTTHIILQKQSCFVTQFYKCNEFVFIQAQTNPFTNDLKGYYIWNLKTNHSEFYKRLNEIPEKYKIDFNQFKSFWENYNAYWHGWRGLLLP